MVFIFNVGSILANDFPSLQPAISRNKFLTYWLFNHCHVMNTGIVRQSLVDLAGHFFEGRGVNRKTRPDQKQVFITGFAIEQTLAYRRELRELGLYPLGMHVPTVGRDEGVFDTPGNINKTILIDTAKVSCRQPVAQPLRAQITFH